MANREKAAIRKEIKARLAALNPQVFAQAGLNAAQKLPLIPGWSAFNAVLAFFSFKDEVDTFPLIQTAFLANKSVFCPCVQGKDLSFYRIIDCATRETLQKSKVQLQEPQLIPHGNQFLINLPRSTRSYTEENEEVLLKTPRSSRLSEGQRSSAVKKQKLNSLLIPHLELQDTDFPALIITPGLAFDRNLMRLGRGGGYYDRFFASLDIQGRNYTAAGLCLDCQIVDKAPSDPWDKRVNMIISC